MKDSKSKIEKTIDFLQKARLNKDLNEDVMESINNKLLELKNFFVYELSNSKEYSHTQDLNVIPVNKIRSKMEPIYFLDRIIINKFAGAYLGTMFSSNNLHFRKYIMKQCFALDQLRSSL